jgi:hypothetical protein
MMITFLFHFFPFYRKAAGRASVNHRNEPFTAQSHTLTHDVNPCANNEKQKPMLLARFDRRGAVNISTKSG